MDNITKNERIDKINKAEKTVREAESLRTSAIALKEQHTTDLKRYEEELKKLGTTPDEAQNKINEIEEEMDSLLKEIEDNLPIELLKEYGKI